MSASSAALLERLPWDDRRGTRAMVLFIATEATLFVMLFFAYFYLGRDEPRWPIDPPPKLTLATIMLAVLLASSVVLHWAETLAKRERIATARLAVAGTCLLGVAFLVLQLFEYRNRLRELLPTTDAYSSIYYTTTGLHALHLILGLAMLAYVLLLPRPERADRPPHRSLHNAALYWHFVDVVWLLIVLLLYYLPHLLPESSP